MKTPSPPLFEKTAEEIEEELFAIHRNTGVSYRSDFRRLFFALKVGARTSEFGNAELIIKDINNDIQAKLLLGDVSAKEFVQMSPQEVISNTRKKHHEQLQEENMRLATLNAEDIPETIRSFEDGRVGEKWWGGSSHAAIDD